jgi:hypothetical protein
VIHVINVMAVRIEGCQVFHESSFPLSLSDNERWAMDKEISSVLMCT